MIVNRGTWNELPEMCQQCRNIRCADIDMSGMALFSCGAYPLKDTDETCPAFKVTPSCATCRHCYQVRKSDYSHGGCVTTPMDGFICMASRYDDIAIWMVGANADMEGCEEWEEKKIGVNRSYACARQEKAVRGVEVVDDAGYTEGTGQLGAK